MYEQWDRSLPRKHHVDYRDRANWGTTKTKKVHSVVYSCNFHLFATHSINLFDGDLQQDSGGAQLNNLHVNDSQAIEALMETMLV